MKATPNILGVPIIFCRNLEPALSLNIRFPLPNWRIPAIVQDASPLPVPFDISEVSLRLSLTQGVNDFSLMQFISGRSG